ncbi:MAG: AAA family ATPase [Bacteroidales bacterium]|nr:AAA family ATPase [Bacteroidales bacterium]
MLGDVLLIEEKHKKAAETIRQKVLGNKKEKMIVTISGESGTGKTELAHSLAKLLQEDGIQAKPLHIDNYYKTHPLEREEWRQKHGIESIGYNEYDWDTIYKNINSFKKGEKAEMPCVDLVTQQVDKLITDFSNVEMLIIDGLYAIKTENADLNVFIDLTYHETKKAQLKRGKEKVNDYRLQVLEQEHQVVRSLRDRAHLIVNKDYQVEEA